MESIRVPFMKDDFGNDILTRLTWVKDDGRSTKSIGKYHTLHRLH